MLYGIQTKEKRTAIKSVFDSSWNVLTLIGVAFLFHAAAGVENPFDVAKVGNDLSAALRSTGSALLSFIFLWVYPTAVGCVAIPLCDALWTPPDAKSSPAVAEDIAIETQPG